jgi:hypothetical protein
VIKSVGSNIKTRECNSPSRKQSLETYINSKQIGEFILGESAKSVSLGSNTG